MPRALRVLPALVAGALLLASAAPLHAQGGSPCPASTYQIDYGNPISFTGPMLSLSVPDLTGRDRSVAFDLPSGTLSSSLGIGNVGWTYVRATDRFDVINVPTGTPVAVVATLDVDGYSRTDCSFPDCGGWFGARIYGAGTTVEQQVTAQGSPTLETPLHTTLTLPVTIVAGTGQTLTFELYEFVAAGVTGGGGGTAKIRFTGLTGNADVVSCEGYSLVTPARPTTWGSLKAIYR